MFTMKRLKMLWFFMLEEVCIFSETVSLDVSWWNQYNEDLQNSQTDSIYSYAGKGYQ